MQYLESARIVLASGKAIELLFLNIERPGVVKQMEPKSTFKDFALPFLAVLAAGLLLGFLLRGYTIADDAYITFRYARNLADGNGPVWNPGERVEGYTCFLHMALCAGAIKAGLDPGLFSHGINLAALALIGALGYRRLKRRSVFLAVLFAAYVGANPAFLAWTYSGMETVLFCAFVFSSVLALESELARGKLPVWTSVTVLLAALTRPEGMMLGLVAGLCLLVYSGKDRWKNIAVYAAFCGLPFAAYFAWRYSYFGWFYPNTYYAKVGVLSGAIVFRGLGYLFKCMLVFLFPFATFGYLCACAGNWKRLPVGTRLFGISFLAFSLQVVLSGGDFMAYARFYLPVLPLAAMVLIDLRRFRRLEKGLSEENPPSGKRWAWLAAGLFAINIVNPFILLNHVKHRVAINLTQAWEKQGKVLRDNTPADAELATAGIGAIGWFSGRPLVDIVGLTDETIAHNPVPKGSGWPGHESHDSDYLLARQPDLLLICNILSEMPWKRCYCELSQRFRFPAVKDLFTRPEFGQTYIFANLDLSGRFLSAYLLRENLGKPGYEKWTPADDADSPCGDKGQLMEELKKNMPAGFQLP